MHGTATAAHASRCLAANLHHHAFEIAALGEIMRVATVGAVDFVGRFKCRAGTDRDRFLANRKMDRAAHLTFSIMIRDRVLDQANAKHLAIQINLPLGVKRSDGGDTLTRCGNCVHAKQSRSCQVLVWRYGMAFHARRHPGWSPSGSQRAPSPAVGETIPLGGFRRVIACGFGSLFFDLWPKPSVLQHIRGQIGGGPAVFRRAPLLISASL